VSQDGIHFTTFPCEKEEAEQLFPGCAGVHPVFANPEINSIDPTDPSVAGAIPLICRSGLDWVFLCTMRFKFRRRRGERGI
jgi:hypothetical protein